ncbi:MAG: OadG family protein [Caldisericum sp.]
MNSQIIEGFMIGLYGITITMFILFLLALVIHLFKFLKLSAKEDIKSSQEEVKGVFGETYRELTSKKMVALSIALAKYFNEKGEASEVRVLRTTPNYIKSIKEKRWKNG